jgi:hypothetical protein
MAQSQVMPPDKKWALAPQGMLSYDDPITSTNQEKGGNDLKTDQPPATLYRRFHPYRTSCIRGGTHRDLARLHRAGVKHHPQNGMNSIQLISWCSWLRPGDPMGLVQTYDLLTLQLVSRDNLVYT